MNAIKQYFRCLCAWVFLMFKWNFVIFALKELRFKVKFDSSKTIWPKSGYFCIHVAWLGVKHILSHFSNAHFILILCFTAFCLLWSSYFVCDFAFTAHVSYSPLGSKHCLIGITVPEMGSVIEAVSLHSNSSRQPHLCKFYNNKENVGEI